jgi:NAD(P)H-dependent FMN reductase
MLSEMNRLAGLTKMPAGCVIPKDTKLQSYIVQLQHKQSAAFLEMGVVPTPASLQEFCKNHSLLPDDQDEYFVLGHELRDQVDITGADFFMAVSTRRLLNFVPQGTNVQVKTTYN